MLARIIFRSADLLIVDEFRSPPRANRGGFHFVQHAVSRLDSGVLDLAGTALRCGDWPTSGGYPALKPTVGVLLQDERAPANFGCDQTAGPNFAVMNGFTEGVTVIR